MFKEIREEMKKERRNEEEKLVRRWKNHPVKMSLRTLSIIAGFFVTLFIIIAIESISSNLAYSSYGYIVFLGQNKWASYASDVLFIIIYIISVGILCMIIELGDLIIECKKFKNDKGSSFSEKERSEEKIYQEEKSEEETDQISNKTAIAILSSIIVLIILFMAGCVYVWTFSSTVFTEDKIIAKSAFNPAGTEYSYSDIAKVKVGNSDTSHLDYDLYMKSGDKVKLRYDGGYSSDNDDYNKYCEAFLSDFTNYLREQNIPIIFNCTYEDISDYYGYEYDKYLKNIFNEK